MAENPRSTWAYRLLVAEHIMAGKMDAAREAAEAFRAHYPNVTIDYLRACLPSRGHVVYSAYLDIFRQAGLPEE